MSMSKELIKKFKAVDEHLIGVWKFRQRGKKPVWCATYQHNGYYYDTFGKLTVESALDQVHKDLQKLNTKKGKADK